MLSSSTHGFVQFFASTQSTSQCHIYKKKQNLSYRFYLSLFSYLRLRGLLSLQYELRYAIRMGQQVQHCYGIAVIRYTSLQAIGLEVQQATRSSVNAGVYICTLRIALICITIGTTIVWYRAVPQLVVKLIGLDRIYIVYLQRASELRLYWEHGTVRIRSIFGMAILQVIYTKAILTPQG